MNNGLLERSKQSSKPKENVLLDVICKPLETTSMCLRDYLVTFTIILFGFICSLVLLSIEYFYSLALKNRQSEQVLRFLLSFPVQPP